MGFRFRKSINIIPGVRSNLSNGAPSLSVGPRGASVFFGKPGDLCQSGLARYRAEMPLTVPRLTGCAFWRWEPDGDPPGGSDRRLSRKPLISCQR